MSDKRRYVGVEPVPYFKYKTGEEQRAAVRAAAEEFDAAQRLEEQARAATRRRVKNVKRPRGASVWRPRASSMAGVHKG